MTDNFTLIKDFIQPQHNYKFDELEDSFYTIEIIGRRKDGSSVDTHKFKTYFINRVEDLDKYEAEIKTICNTLKMRAYISINSKSFRQVTLNTMAEYADRIAKNNFDKPYSVFESCTGKFVDRSKQLWIIDVDKEDADKFNCTLDDLVTYYRTVVEYECEPKKKIVTIIPTKSGKHIICHPFDISKFKSVACYTSDIESLIKKNNATLLYENI